MPPAARRRGFFHVRTMLAARGEQAGPFLRPLSGVKRTRFARFAFRLHGPCLGPAWYLFRKRARDPPPSPIAGSRSRPRSLVSQRRRMVKCRRRVECRANDGEYVISLACSRRLRARPMAVSDTSRLQTPERSRWNRSPESDRLNPEQSSVGTSAPAPGGVEAASEQ